MKTTISSILETIGGTYLLRLSKLKEFHGYDGEIYAKLEHMTPSFSKKDRIALGMVELAEKKGLLKKGMPVIEMTSGNTGCSLAMVCAVKGYRFICVMSRGNSIERIKMIEAFGGEVVLVDQGKNAEKGKVSGEDLQLVEIATERIIKETSGFYLNQFNNLDNAISQETIAEEVYEQLEGKVDVFADFIGTGGTFAGCSRAFKKLNKNIHCYAVEPQGCAFYGNSLSEGATHSIQGGGYGKHMTIVEKENIDGSVIVSDDEAITMTRELAKYEGVFGGFSAGANVCAAIKLLEGKEKGKNIVVVINDCGLKYMSTSLF